MRTILTALVISLCFFLSSCAAAPGSTGNSSSSSVGSSSSSPSVITNQLTNCYVDAVSGSDSNPGTSSQPFKTITYAIISATNNAVINLQPGTYNAALGETFPLSLKPGQLLTGDIPNKGNGSTPTKIIGTGAVFSTGYYSAVVLTNGNTVAGVIVDCTSYQVSFMGIYVNGGSSICLSNNIMDNNCYGGIYLDNGSTAVIEENIIRTSSYGIYSYNSVNTIIRNNAIVSASFGMRIDGSTTGMMISNNTFTNNSMEAIQDQYGAYSVISNFFYNTTGYAYGGVNCISSYGNLIRKNKFQCASNAILINQTGAKPDCGTIANPGLNDFSSVTGAAYLISVSCTNTNFAIGNIWVHNPPISADIAVTAPSVVYWGTNTNTQKLP